MAEINIEKMAKNVAEKALDEFLYDGKSIREWVKIIAEQEPKTKWIPVSERFPEESKRYMVSTKFGEVMTDFYTGTEFLQGGDIVSWMPLPEPYKAESEESDG